MPRFQNDSIIRLEIGFKFIGKSWDFMDLCKFIANKAGTSLYRPDSSNLVELEGKNSEHLNIQPLKKTNLGLERVSFLSKSLALE